MHALVWKEDGTFTLVAAADTPEPLEKLMELAQREYRRIIAEAEGEYTRNLRRAEELLFPGLNEGGRGLLRPERMLMALVERGPTLQSTHSIMTLTAEELDDILSFATPELMVNVEPQPFRLDLEGTWEWRGKEYDTTSMSRELFEHAPYDTGSRILAVTEKGTTLLAVTELRSAWFKRPYPKDDFYDLEAVRRRDAGNPWTWTMSIRVVAQG